MQLGRSARKHANSSGPKILPSGTPDRTGVQSDCLPITRALLGGRLNAPPPGFSRLAKIRRRAAPPGFHPPYPPSFLQLLWKFRPNAMWGQVTRSGQVTQLQNNLPIAPLHGYNVSGKVIELSEYDELISAYKTYISDFWYRWPQVRSFLRPPHL